MGLEHAVLLLLKTRHGRAIIALLLTAAGTFFAILLLPQVGRSRALSENHLNIPAYVIDSKESRGMHYFDVSYDLRYRFRLNPRGAWYFQTEDGPFARGELWATLPRQDWEKATRRGWVEVAYLPADPRVNTLAADVGHELRNTYLGVGFSLLFLVPGTLWLSYYLITALIWLTRPDGERAKPRWTTARISRN